ncbi:hypothetical protein PCANC_10551 [Puccinia coronata f. sp. avenae]|uniref:Uncharacterized protein n=1 Tax=Puccinia coronata f. sp. avenae TaxID=200324 RepID=A0A2N5VZ98_9BASI|nr:hypothetical protein PCANC_10551 [Puccinia coronata f. sp. avenae]
MSIEGNLNHQPDQRQQKSKKRHTSVISCLGNLGKLRNTKGDFQSFHLQKANRDCLREDELQHPSSGRSGDIPQSATSGHPPLSPRIPNILPTDPPSLALPPLAPLASTLLSRHCH